MDVRFDGKVAVITGGGAGLGRRYALELARRGASVVVNDLGGAVDGTGADQGVAAGVAEEIKTAGGQAVANTDSVTTAEGGRAVIETALDAFGRVDILINNAGILRPEPFADLDLDVLGAVLDVHLKGAFNVSVPAVKAMRANGGGRIVNTTSGSVFGAPTHTNYGSAKAGLIGLTRTLALEGAEYGVSVNAIMPIATTRMTEEFLGPMAALLDPDFVVPTVCWLAHADCPANGEIFSLGGGRVARVFLAETPGWTESTLSDHTAEAVRDHWDDICDDSTHAVPRSFEEEMGLFVNAIA